MKGERRKCAACKKRRIVRQHGICDPCLREPQTDTVREIVRKNTERQNQPAKG